MSKLSLVCLIGGFRLSDVASCRGNGLSEQGAAQPPFCSQRTGFFVALNSYVLFGQGGGGWVSK